MRSSERPAECRPILARVPSTIGPGRGALFAVKEEGWRLKIFWSIIAALAILTAALLIASRDKVMHNAPGDRLPRRVYAAGSQTPSPMGDREVASQPAPPSELRVTAGEIADPPPSGDDSSPANPDRLRLNSPEVNLPGESRATQSNDADAAALTPNAPAEIVILDPKVEPNPSDAERESRIKALEAEPVARNADGIDPVATAQEFEHEEPAATAAKHDAPTNAPTEASRMVHPTLEKRDDGSTLVDGRFILRGKGTKTDPYQVPWNMLVATSETFDPHSKNFNLPERLTMLSGQYVRVVGHIAFPVDAHGPDEMLVMLHAWDGCCVGVRPSPWDAIEVRLENPPTAEQMLMSWGRVTGRFQAHPHPETDSGLTLYTIEVAVLTEENK